MSKKRTINLTKNSIDLFDEILQILIQQINTKTFITYNKLNMCNGGFL